jgi:hypothetical protein
MHNKAGWRGSSPSASLAVHGFELLLEGISEQLVSVTSRESVSSYWRFFWGRSRALALTARHSGPLQAASTPPAFRASATPVPRARLRLGRSMRGCPSALRGGRRRANGATARGGACRA